MREKSRERAARPPAGGDPPRRAGRRPPRPSRALLVRSRLGGRRGRGGARRGSPRRVTGAGDHERQPVDRLDTDLLAELERLVAARVPDLSPQPHAAERRAAHAHLAPLADQPLGTGPDRVAAQKPDLEQHLSHLDHRRGEDGDHAPRIREYEQPDDRQHEQHPPKDAASAATSLRSEPPQSRCSSPGRSKLIERAGHNGERNPDTRLPRQKNTDARPVIRCHRSTARPRASALLPSRESGTLGAGQPGCWSMGNRALSLGLELEERPGPRLLAGPPPPRSPAARTSTSAERR
jgi:hypothetical protein